MSKPVRRSLRLDALGNDKEPNTATFSYSVREQLAQYVGVGSKACRQHGLMMKKWHEKSPAQTPLQYNLYSPTTGTRKISTPAAADKLDVKGHQKDEGQGASTSIPAVPESSSRGQHPTNENADVLELLSHVEKSLEVFLKMRQSLKTLQALEGDEEFGQHVGFVASSNNLKAELQETKALISQARRKKQKTC